MTNLKNSISKIILEKALELGKVTLEILLPPKSHPRGRMARAIFGLDSRKKISPKTIPVLLSRLKKQGLIERRGKWRSSTWHITGKGKKFLEKNKIMLYNPPPRDGQARLVIFDIPEKERRKRDVLRAELVSNNFIKLQKSVWIGYNPLPEDFIEFLDNLNLSDKIHIFSVKEKGTISN